MAKNLSWTSSLGQAFENQQSDVMAAVQVMRAKAQAAGNDFLLSWADQVSASDLASAARAGTYQVQARSATVDSPVRTIKLARLPLADVL